MSRVIDAITRHGFIPTAGYEDRAAAMVDQIRASVVYAGDNIMTYAIEVGTTPFLRGGALTPPAELTWVDFKIDVSFGKGTFLHGYGVSLHTVDFGPKRDDGRRSQDSRDEIAQAIENFAVVEDAPYLRATDPRWIVYNCIYVRRGTTVSGPQQHGATFLDDDGDLVLFRRDGAETDAVANLSWMSANGGEVKPSVGETVGRFYRALLWPAFLAFRFSHCRNVRRVEEGGTWPTRQARRAAERRGEPPPAKFYTLRIDPNATRTNDAQRSTGNHRDLALHIVRGHFHTYSAERPMFGKYSGTFWVPAHVRGSADAGMVGKDYAIVAPTELQ